jgi:hypothetical protein
MSKDFLVIDTSDYWGPRPELTSLSESAVLYPRSPQIVDTDGSQEIQEHTGCARAIPPAATGQAGSQQTPGQVDRLSLYACPPS